MDIDKCNGCHTLSLAARRKPQPDRACACCATTRARTTASYASVRSTPADKTLPPQAVNFALMVHKIHTGENMTTDFNQTYTIVGFGGSHNDFTDVRYPAMGPTGASGDTAKCYMCHVNGSEAVLPDRQEPVRIRRAAEPGAGHHSACTACHSDCLGSGPRACRRPIRSSAKAAMSATPPAPHFDVQQDARRPIIEITGDRTPCSGCPHYNRASPDSSSSAPP